MPKAFPSDIVGLIDERFSWARSVVHPDHDMQPGEALWIAGLVDLLDSLPDGLLAVSRSDYARFIIARAGLRHAVSASMSAYLPRPWPVVREMNAVAVVRNILVKCPDESQQDAVNGLEFVLEEELRRTLVSDLAALERSAMNGEWKAVTVLGGSLLEALLLWSIQKHRGEELTSALERLPREIGKPRDAHRPEKHGRWSTTSKWRDRCEKSMSRPRMPQGWQETSGISVTRAANSGSVLDAIARLLRRRARPSIT